MRSGDCVRAESDAVTPAAGRAWAWSACNEQTIQSLHAYSQYRFLVVNSELVGKLVTLGMNNRRGVVVVVVVVVVRSRC